MTFKQIRFKSGFQPNPADNKKLMRYKGLGADLFGQVKLSYRTCRVAKQTVRRAHCPWKII